MALKIPSIDDRRYQELLDEALSRIPIHTPEWTNFGPSDPGVTILEVFAFLTETLLYRANQIPERNRRKFLSLLGVQPRPASSAVGLVQFLHEKGKLETNTLPGGLEVLAGSVPFRTQQGLDVLPISAKVYVKRVLNENQITTQQRQYYERLYSSHQASTQSALRLYETVPLEDPKHPNASGVSLADAVDNSLWIALLAREKDDPNEARDQIAGKTLSLGLVPLLTDPRRDLRPNNREQTGLELLRFELPRLAADGKLENRAPAYRALEARSSVDVLNEPGVVDLTLPDASGLGLWQDIDPLEAGVGDLPPTLEDTDLEARVITWLRVRSLASASSRFLWVGINAAMVNQRSDVLGEVLPEGTGEPDQAITLGRHPVIPGSVRLKLTARPLGPAGTTAGTSASKEIWTAIDDLVAAGPEVPIEDASQPPGTRSGPQAPDRVFKLDPLEGVLHFGDGFHGRRPPLGALLRADYAVTVGRAGNLGAGAIASASGSPNSIRVTNPVRTWGGADAESIQEAEKSIPASLRHQHRLVTVSDFQEITQQTPGVDIGRIEVLPAFNPDLGASDPGGAPGAITLMILPSYDPVSPEAPMPDQLFLDAICDHLEPRRLVTSEVFLRPPRYKNIQVSIGLVVESGSSAAEVREAVKREVRRFLSPLPQENTTLFSDLEPISLPSFVARKAERGGWPLRKPVVALELAAVASRVSGVQLVSNVLLGEGGGAVSQISMSGLELPRLTALEAVIGDAVGLDQLRGEPQTVTGPRLLPVPVIPEECR
jgi:Baseplate J-like protein